MEKKTKVFIGQIKSVDEEKFTVEAVVSDETIDRYGEVILADAYKKRLGNYKKHGVLLSSHNYGSLLKQIGMAESVKIEDGKLICKFRWFVNEGNPESDWGWKLASKYKVAAFSVGFLPYAAEDGDWEKDGEAIKAGKKPCRKFTDVELLEVSQVLVPANPMALQKSMEDLVSEDVDEVTKTIIKEYSEEVLEIIKKEEYERELINDSISIKSDLEEDIILKNKNEEIEKKEEEEMKNELLKAINDLDEKLNKDLENIFIKINELSDKLVKQKDESDDNNSIATKIKETEEKERIEKEFLNYAKELFEVETKKLEEIFPVQS